MAIAYDAASNVAAGTGNLSWTHTPVGTPRGVLVLIAQNVGTTDEVTGVTYGGVAMREVQGSPLLHTAGSEDGALYGYFLGTGIPTGAQTVAVTVSGSSSKRAVCYSVTASTDVEVEATTTKDASSGTNPFMAIATSTGVTTFIAGVIHSGIGAVSSIAAAAGYTDVLEHDYGSQCASWTRRTSNLGGGSTNISWTCGTSEEYGILGVALREQRDGFFFDSEWSVAAGTGDLSWDTNPYTNNVRGVLVAIVSNTRSDEVTSVTYGGVALEEVSGSPLATHAGAGGAGVVHFYVLKTGALQGAQTVSVTVSGSTSKRAVCYIFGSTRANGVAVRETFTHAPSSNDYPDMAGTLSQSCILFGAAFSSMDSTSGFGVSSENRIVLTHDFGTECAAWWQLVDGAAASPGVVPSGYAILGLDNSTSIGAVAVFGVALIEGYYLGQPSETDTAIAFLRTLGRAAETDEGLALSRAKKKLLGLNSEADSIAAAMGHYRARAMAQNEETDATAALSRSKKKTIGVDVGGLSILGSGKVVFTALDASASIDIANEAEVKAVVVFVVSANAPSGVSLVYRDSSSVGVPSYDLRYSSSGPYLRTFLALNTGAIGSWSGGNMRVTLTLTGAPGVAVAVLLGSPHDAEVGVDEATSSVDVTTYWGIFGSPNDEARDYIGLHAVASYDPPSTITGTTVQTDDTSGGVNWLHVVRPSTTPTQNGGSATTRVDAASGNGCDIQLMFYDATGAWEADSVASGIGPTRAKKKTIGQGSETDTALGTFGRRKARTLGLDEETDTPTGIGTALGLDAVTETDEALAPGRLKSRTLGLDEETDEATPFPAITYVPVGQSSETDETLGALGRVKAKAIGQGSETDTNAALGRAKRKALGQSSETDTNAALGRMKTRAIGQGSEVDTTAALGRAKARALGLDEETDTPTGVGRRKARALAQGTETDTPTGIGTALGLDAVTEADAAQAVGRAKSKAIGQNAETDTALGTFGRRKAKALGQGSETDTTAALGRRKAKALGQSTETSVGQAVGRAKKKTIGQSVEADTATSLGLGLGLDTVTETDAGLALGRMKAKATGTAASPESATAIARAKAKAIGQSTETDAGQTFGRRKAKAIGQSAETDTSMGVGTGIGLDVVSEVDAAQVLGRSKSKELGMPEPLADTALGVGFGFGLETASETGTPLAFGRAKRKALAQGEDTGSAQALTRAKKKTIGQSEETDTNAKLGQALGQGNEADAGVSLGRLKTLALMQLEGTDTGFALGRAKRKALAQGEDASTAQPVSRAKSKAIGQGSEVDAGLALGRLKSTALTQAGDAGSGLSLGRAKAKVIGQGSEADTPAPLFPLRARGLAPVSEVDTTGTPLGRGKRKAIGQGAEVGTAGKLSRAKSLGQGADASTNAALGRRKRKDLGHTSEVDAIQNLGDTGKAAVVNQTMESDSIAALGRAKAKALGQGAEVDAAQHPSRALSLKPTSEVDEAHTVTRLRAYDVGQGSESDTAGSTTPSRGRRLGEVGEADAVQNLGRRRSRTLAQGTEGDSVTALGRSKRRTLPTATSPEAAHPIGRTKRKGLLQPAEDDTAQPTRAAHSTSVGIGQAADAGEAPALGRKKRRALGSPLEVDTAQPVTRRRRSPPGKAVPGRLHDESALAGRLAAESVVPGLAAVETRITGASVLETRARGIVRAESVAVGTLDAEITVRGVTLKE